MRPLRRPPIAAATGDGGFIGDPKSAADAEKLNCIFAFQFGDQWRKFFDRSHEGRRLGDLRSDVRLHAANGNGRHFTCPLVNLRGSFQRDAELVLALTGGDVLMRLRFDIGVHSKCNRGALAFSRCDLVDVIELGFALDVERINPLFECVFDLFARFSHSGEGAFA